MKRTPVLNEGSRTHFCLIKWSIWSLNLSHCQNTKKNMKDTSLNETEHSTRYIFVERSTSWNGQKPKIGRLAYNRTFKVYERSQHVAFYLVTQTEACFLWGRVRGWSAWSKHFRHITTADAKTTAVSIALKTHTQSETFLWRYYYLFVHAWFDNERLFEHIIDDKNKI